MATWDPRHRAVLVVCGVSGSGKSHLIAALCRDEAFVAVPSVTTRSPRPGEVDGVNKVFVGDAEFERRLRAGDLVCAAENFGARYAHDASLILSVPGVPVVELAAKSALVFRERFLGAAFIRVVPAEADLAEVAIAGRGEDGTAIVVRREEISRSGPEWPSEISWAEVVNRYDADSEGRFVALARRQVGLA